MSAFGHSKPAFVNTYGKQKRRVERWFSPDLRKKAFSFSSTPSSDQSFPELTSKKRKIKKSTASVSSRTLRLAKQKAVEALKDMESDDESIFNPATTRRRKASIKLGFKCNKKDYASHHTVKTRKKQPVCRNYEKDTDSFVTKNKCSNSFRQRTSSNFKEGEPAGLDRFVTHRKKVLPMQSDEHISNLSLGISSNTLNTSKTICGAPSFSHYVTNCKQLSTQEKPKPSSMFHRNPHSHSSTILREVSFNDVDDWMMSCKRPLLCSTPSLTFKQNLKGLKPSIHESASFSCDESDKFLLINERTTNDLMNKPLKHGMLKKSNKCAKQAPKTETLQQIDKHTKYTNGEIQLELEKCQPGSSIENVSTQACLKQLNERAVIILEKLDVSDILSNKSDENQEEEKMHSPKMKVAPSTSVTAIPSFHGNQTCHTSSVCSISGASNQALHTTSLCPSTFLSVSSFSAPPTYEPSSSLQTQIDRLKVQCLSSCPKVCLQRLELSTNHQAHLRTIGTRAQVASSFSLEPETGQKARKIEKTNFPCLLEMESAEQLSGTKMQTGGLPAFSLAPITVSRKMSVEKERNGLCTSRNVSVSGLSSSRWSKRAMGVKNKKQIQDVIRTKPGDCSSSDLLPCEADSFIRESAYSWLQSSSAIGSPKTPLRVELLNLSSFLANFTPDSLTTHNWGRLKAALSIHKKKTAFPTPRRLASPNTTHPELLDRSLQLFGTPVSNQTSSHLLRSRITNTSMILFNEDISDAEKVYQECQQDGPLFFEDCIPPECMKHCIKIGEGTFGEVFSMVNNAKQNVALKIIPVEGHQKVNGETQKTFGEVLHEIIISKELSALNSKEDNKTDGFIGLINLHCVHGCYPSTLLKAWDKFDQKKGSENDRPDFFGKEQLFLILEFEFGGSDLENLNGKLTSMAQAKSVLHQVTAALAVAEEALCFEHRDLHWGNILVKNTKQKYNQFLLNGSLHSVETQGVHVNIIDYSLSRLETDGLTVSCDIANDEELFMGQGDYQFEIYRLMRKENSNCWADYNPHSNVLWLHYLADKLLTMRYRNKPQTIKQKSLKSSLSYFHSEILNYHSAKEVLLHANLFK